ncbi:GNAT family N-acetyltransferase [Algivirga pacifica]|uniref:GNAT family N-acetyltransferase n=1 Tax=Algivirga pacifica TaxID=1162670 RepID=A0ABP9DBJ2_9BACT
MDMLVKLYDLPHPSTWQEKTKQLQLEGIEIRHAIAPEKHVIVDWVREHFNPHWASEVEVAFIQQPVSCIIATHEKQMIGFAAYEATGKTFFGPTGVLQAYRGLGIGKVLLLEALQQLKHMGYAYGIIGGVGPVEFYENVVGATLIENSTPGIYRGMLR